MPEPKKLSWWEKRKVDKARKQETASVSAFRSAKSLKERKKILDDEIKKKKKPNLVKNAFDRRRAAMKDAMKED
jgi:hypothetical protein